jgi:hypothetical protein
MASECSFGEDHCGVVIVLEAENARLKEALKKCYRSLCAYVDRDYREGGPLSAYDAEGAIAKAREVLGYA